MSEVVDSAHEEAEHEEDDGVLNRLAAYQAAPALAAVVRERAEESEHRRRRTHREPDAHRRAEEESAESGDRIDNDGPRGPDDVGHRGTEIAHPHHVEQNVEKAAVKPARAEERPPVAEHIDGNRAAHAEQEERAIAGDQKIDSACERLQLIPRYEQRQQV